MKNLKKTIKKLTEIFFYVYKNGKKQIKIKQIKTKPEEIDQ